MILHTDQGSEYTAHRFRAACTRLGIRQSMGRPGSALDNAVIESWHSTLEFELRSLEHFTTRAQARARVAAWIEDYNHDRRHSALGCAPRSTTSSATADGMTLHPDPRPVLAPSSPASRPSPPGGLRPALTPAPGGSASAATGAGHRTQDQIPLMESLRFQGIAERFQQTLKRWLAAQPTAATIAELQTQLDTFTGIYNQIRPHRALHGATPANAYPATIKAAPAAQRRNPHYRVRNDHVDRLGKISLRRAVACTTSASAPTTKVRP